MYVEVKYYCPKCAEYKLTRIGNKGLPEISLKFQIEIQGIICPSCGYKIKMIHPDDYYLISDDT